MLLNLDVQLGNNTLMQILVKTQILSTLHLDISTEQWSRRGNWGWKGTYRSVTATPLCASLGQALSRLPQATTSTITHRHYHATVCHFWWPPASVTRVAKCGGSGTWIWHHHSSEVFLFTINIKKNPAILLCCTTSGQVRLRQVW